MKQKSGEDIASLLHVQVTLPLKVLLSTFLMLALIALVYLFHIPNPNMVLIVGLVLCSASFGYGGGVVAAVIMLVYTLYFFSTDHSFLSFTELNLWKLVISFLGIVLNLVLVCSLKRAELEAFREIRSLSDQLKQENAYLQVMSLTDGLTRVKNRMALRQDYDALLGKEVTVILMDLNRFKEINDTLGHEEGDRVLVETGQLLSKYFGRDCCYRYGGDEFLIITELPEAAAREKLTDMGAELPHLSAEGGGKQLAFSVGVAHETLRDADTLRELFAQADERMYRHKRSGSPL